MNAKRVKTILVLMAMALVPALMAFASGGEIEYKSSSFSHAAHVDEMGFPCEECHSGLFEMKAGKMEATPGFNMEMMYDGKFCGACHDGEMAFASDDNCITCHDKNGGQEIKYNSVVFSHSAHIDGIGFSCDACHSGMFEMRSHAILSDPDFSMQAIYDGQYCGACHDGSMAFASDKDCMNCHESAQGDIIYVKPVKAVIFDHDAHREMFDCKACHDGMFAMEALKAQEYDDYNMEALYDGKYCGACHDGAMAFASDTRCATCHIGVKGYQRLINGEKSAGSSAEH